MQDNMQDQPGEEDLIDDGGPYYWDILRKSGKYPGDLTEAQFKELWAPDKFEWGRWCSYICADFPQFVGIWFDKDKFEWDEGCDWCGWSTGSGIEALEKYCQSSKTIWGPAYERHILKIRIFESAWTCVQRWAQLIGLTPESLVYTIASYAANAIEYDDKPRRRKFAKALDALARKHKPHESPLPEGNQPF